MPPYSHIRQSTRFSQANTHFLSPKSGLNVLAFILIYLFVYETKEATLEELNSIFSVPTRAHVEYQVREVLPWAWRHYARRAREPRVPSLHVWYKARQREAARSRALEMRKTGSVGPQSPVV